jgi:hypothetical protein
MKGGDPMQQGFISFPPEAQRCAFTKNKCMIQLGVCLSERCRAPKRVQKARDPKFVCLTIRKEFIKTKGGD